MLGASPTNRTQLENEMKSRKTLISTLLATSLMAAAALTTSASAGDVEGPGCATHQVQARSTDLFRVTFTGEQPAWVSIRGDGDTDLDLEIRDDGGNRICMADGTSDSEMCRWTPRRTGAFEVRVMNPGPVYNEYRICTN